MAEASTSHSMAYDEFVTFVFQPENSERHFEFIKGEIVEALPTSTYISQIPLLLAESVYTYCDANHLSCYVSGATGPYHIQGNIVLPKFAYKRTPMSEEYPDPIPPSWAMHIVSQHDLIYDIRNRRNIYLAANILYWEMYPQVQSIDVYAPGQSMRTVGIDDVLDGGDVLPGFMLPVKELFPDQPNS
jgi:Uma2 family endonuclease